VKGGGTSKTPQMKCVDLTNEKTTIYAKPFASTLTDNLLRDPKEFSTNIQMVIDYINQK